jgi:hypothetical protein
MKQTFVFLFLHASQLCLAGFLDANPALYALSFRLCRFSVTTDLADIVPPAIIDRNIALFRLGRPRGDASGCSPVREPICQLSTKAACKCPSFFDGP